MFNLTLWLSVALLTLWQPVECSTSDRRTRLQIPVILSQQNSEGSIRLPTGIYPFLRGEHSTEDRIMAYLSTSLLFKADSEVLKLLKEYKEWFRFELFDLFSQRITFESDFDALLNFIAEVAEDNRDERYFLTLLTNQATFIYENIDKFWNFMIEKYGCCSLLCLTVADCLQKHFFPDYSVKRVCSFYLLSGLFKKPEIPERVNSLLNSPVIDPNCNLSPCGNDDIFFPFVYTLLNCADSSRPTHYYSCFFDCPRVNINCVIPAFSLLDPDPEQSAEFQVCELPLIFHALILRNWLAFYHLVINRRLNYLQIARYLPQFIH